MHSIRIIILLSVVSLLTAGCHDQTFVVRVASSNPALQESVLSAVSDDGWLLRDKIAIIDVDGIMVNSDSAGLLGRKPNPVSVFIEKLDRAANDENVKALILRLNSPGGTVAASDCMHHALREFRRDTGKPVLACMLDVAASGAYYLACGADGIIAQPTTVTGSIGVIMQTISFEHTMLKIGVKSEAIKSGDLKDLASPFHDLQPDERAVLKAIIDDFYAQFLDIVLTGRSDLQRDTLLPQADGRVLTAQVALDGKLIDRIGYPADAVTWAKQLADLEKAKVVLYHHAGSYAPNIYASASAPAPESLIDLPLPSWLRAEGPQFLYLWSPQP